MALSDTPRLILRLTAATMLAVEIAIHAALAPDHLREVPYIGALFLVASGLLCVVLIGILAAPRKAMFWQVGAAICIGMPVGFAASRTVGLPGYHESWTSDAGLGLISLPPELIFVGCAVKMLPGPAQRLIDAADPAITWAAPANAAAIANPSRPRLRETGYVLPLPVRRRARQTRAR
jgi:hypothetical protein